MKTGKLITLLLSPMMLFSCSDEISMPENGDSVSIEITVPRQDDLKTRAFGDGSSINNLKCYVYAQGRGNTGEPITVDDISLSSSDNKAYYHIQLPQGQNYDLVFLATSGEQENPSGKIYYNRTDRTFNVNYGNFTANDESVDCFMGSIQNLSDAQTSYSITLKRPFAQLNIGTKDLDDYNALSVAKLSAVDVSVDGVYSSMNAMNGNVIGGKSKVTFPQLTSFSNEPFPVPDSKYLSMNYLLMNARENAAVTMKTTSSDGSNIDFAFNNVPLQRNFKTNIYGNLLTKSNDYKVEISPEFTSQENVDVNSDYDLVIKLVDNYKDWTMFGLEYTDKAGQKHTVDLLPYVDSEKTIKVGWSELGLEGVDNIRYVFQPISQSSNPMSELIKMDISPLQLTVVSDMFENSAYVENFNAVNNWDTSNFTETDGMFRGCTKMKDINVANWKTGNVFRMTGMFEGCSSLIDLKGIANWDISSVKYIGHMFDGCSSLGELNIADWKTGEVQTMDYMFRGCSSLNELDVTKWDTSWVDNMEHMFEGCSSITKFDLFNWNVSHLKNIKFMFRGCSSLNDFYPFAWNNSITSLESVFEDCEALYDLELLGDWDVKNVTNMANLFKNCTYLYDVYFLEEWDTANVENMTGMFSGCRNLTDSEFKYIADWDTHNVKTMESMFRECSKVTALDLTKWNTENVTDMRNLFADCYDLKDIDISNWNTSNLIYASGLFYGCNHIININLSEWDTRNLVNINLMFYHCNNLKTLELSNWNTSNLVDISNFINGCHNLTSIYLDNWNLNKIVATNYMNDAFDTKWGDHYDNNLQYIRCKQSLKDWCMQYAEIIKLPDAMKDGTGTWDIVP